MDNQICCDRWHCCAAGVVWKLRGKMYGNKEQLNFIIDHCQTEIFWSCPHYDLPRSGNETKK